MHTLRIIYDGWPLVRQPLGPAALHLLDLLAYLPSEVEPVVALPAPPPGWLKDTPTHVHSTPDTNFARLEWEQLRLPQLARALDASLLHLTTPAAPLFGQPVSVISPGSINDLHWKGEHPALKEPKPLNVRLRESLAHGGLSRVRGIFWPAGLPQPDLPARIFSLPQVVHPSFIPTPGPGGEIRDDNSPSAGGGLQTVDLPETYVLYHGPTSAYWLERTLQAWSWAASSIGEYYPMLLLGLDRQARGTLAGLEAKFNVSGSVRALPSLSPEDIPALYRGCSALFHPTPLSPWGGPVNSALACGKPVVATDSTLADALVGPAAYLAPLDDARALGAALITVLVEEEVAEKLALAAQQQVAGWHSSAFGQELLAAYQEILSAP